MLKQGTLYLSSSSIIFMFSSYIINVWLGRSLGPVSYGIYGIVISLMTMVNLIQTSGLPQAVSKYIAQDETKVGPILKSGLNLQVISTAIITLVYFLLAKPIALILKDISLVPYIQISAFIFPFYGIYAIYTGYYNGLHDFKRQAIISTTYSIFKTIFVIGLAFIFHIKGAIAGFIVAPLFAILAGLKLLTKSSQTFPYKKLVLFSLPLIGFAFLSTLLQSVDLYFVKALLLSEKDPGYYTANQNIARIPFFALSAFSLVLFPSISKNLAQKQIEKIRSMIHSSLRFILMLLIPGTLLIAVTSEQIIDLLYSAVYLPAAPSLSVLIFASGFLTVFTVLANILNGAGSPKISLAISALGVAITAIFCLMLVPVYGLVGAALSTTIGSFAAMIIATYYVYRRFQALVPIKSTVKIIFASLIVAVIAYFVTLPSVILLPLLYLLLFAIYAGLLVLLGELTREDWKTVRSLLPKER